MPRSVPPAARRLLGRGKGLAWRTLRNDRVRRLTPAARRVVRAGTRRYVALARGDRARSDPQYRPSTADQVLSSTYEQLVREHAPGRSFVDVGCMWRVHGAVAFLAEEVGATQTSAYDLIPATPEFLAAHEARGSSVRFVHGHVMEGKLVEHVGTHDVVWCTGVLYHTPDPHGFVRELCAASDDRVVIGTKAIPEVPGFPQACIFFPGLPEDDRSTWAQVFGDGVAKPFGRLPWYESEWWWGLSPSALEAMVGSQPGWRVIDVAHTPWSGADDNLFVIAERTAPRD